MFLLREETLADLELRAGGGLTAMFFDHLAVRGDSVIVLRLVLERPAQTELRLEPHFAGAVSFEVAAESLLAVGPLLQRGLAFAEAKCRGGHRVILRKVLDDGGELRGRGLGFVLLEQ